MTRNIKLTDNFFNHSIISSFINFDKIFFLNTSTLILEKQMYKTKSKMYVHKNNVDKFTPITFSVVAPYFDKKKHIEMKKINDEQPRSCIPNTK